MLKYELGSPTGDVFVEDSRVWCRGLLNMSCTLGWFSPEPGDKSKKEFVSLHFNARYYTDTNCLLVIWRVTPDNGAHHRSALVNWNGGIETHLLINSYLNEALEWVARQLGHPEFANGSFYKSRVSWTPREEFKPVMEAVLGGTEVVYLPEV